MNFTTDFSVFLSNPEGFYGRWSISIFTFLVLHSTMLNFCISHNLFSPWPCRTSWIIYLTPSWTVPSPVATPQITVSKFSTVAKEEAFFELRGHWWACGAIIPQGRLWAVREYLREESCCRRKTPYRKFPAGWERDGCWEDIACPPVTSFAFKLL
jgi:hypothetical protein